MSLASLIRELRPSAWVERTCDRIDEHDGELCAFLDEPGRRVRLRAAAAELERREPLALHGVPVGVKDIFAVDGFPTRAGSALPAQLFLGPQAACVDRLVAAGALVAGKTATTEFAMLDPGPTRNPRAPAHTPGGSSSGSAAAVAAGLVPLAIGSQTTGSVIRPAAFCGIVGFKPSFGRISTAGMLGCSASVDTVGFFTVDVDSARFAAAVVVDDWNPRPTGADRRPVIGVPDGPFLDWAEPEARHSFERQLELLAESGIPIVRVGALADADAIGERHASLVAFEFARVHAAWFAEHGALYRPCARGLVESGRTTTEAQAQQGRRSRIELRERLHRLMDGHAIDLWASPAATGPAPAGIEATGNPAMNMPWTHAGLPTVSVPAGRAANGLPLGMQASGRLGADEVLLAWAATLERVLAAHDTK